MAKLNSVCEKRSLFHVLDTHGKLRIDIHGVERMSPSDVRVTFIYSRDMDRGIPFYFRLCKLLLSFSTVQGDHEGMSSLWSRQ